MGVICVNNRENKFSLLHRKLLRSRDCTCSVSISPAPPGKVLREDFQGLIEHCLKFTEANLTLKISLACSALSCSLVSGDPSFRPYRKGRRGRTRGSMTSKLSNLGLGSSVGSANCQGALHFLICKMGWKTTPPPSCVGVRCNDACKEAVQTLRATRKQGAGTIHRLGRTGSSVPRGWGRGVEEELPPSPSPVPSALPRPKG